MANGKEMTTSNLRERVATAIEESLYGTERIGRTDTLQYGLEADAAIAIVLEEAAKVCDRYAKHDWKLGEGFRSLAGIELAADIRALKDT
jgi:hypothetical protein